MLLHKWVGRKWVGRIAKMQRTALLSTCCQMQRTMQLSCKSRSFRFAVASQKSLWRFIALLKTMLVPTRGTEEVMLNNSEQRPTVSLLCHIHCAFQEVIRDGANLGIKSNALLKAQLSSAKQTRVGIVCGTDYAFMMHVC